MTDFLVVHITVASQGEADTIAQALVRERLVACVNIIPGMKSVYQWQGNVEESQEILLIAKTRVSLFEAVRERVKGLHSYECPCIVAMPLCAGHPPFLDWLGQETKP